jgi:hypothetical protein
MRRLDTLRRCVIVRIAYLKEAQTIGFALMMQIVRCLNIMRHADLTGLGKQRIFYVFIFCALNVYPADSLDSTHKIEGRWSRANLSCHGTTNIVTSGDILQISSPRRSAGDKYCTVREKIIMKNVNSMITIALSDNCGETPGRKFNYFIDGSKLRVEYTKSGKKETYIKIKCV